MSKNFPGGAEKNEKKFQSGKFAFVCILNKIYPRCRSHALRLCQFDN